MALPIIDSMKTKNPVCLTIDKIMRWMNIESVLVWEKVYARTDVYWLQYIVECVSLEAHSSAR